MTEYKEKVEIFHSEFKNSVVCSANWWDLVIISPKKYLDLALD